MRGEGGKNQRLQQPAARGVTKGSRVWHRCSGKPWCILRFRELALYTRRHALCAQTPPHPKGQAAHYC